jgi:hypothetical protein
VKPGSLKHEPVELYIPLATICSYIVNSSLAGLKLWARKFAYLGTLELDVRETGWDSMDRIHLAEDRNGMTVLENTVMNLRVP